MVYTETQSMKKFWWLLLVVIIPMITTGINWYTTDSPMEKEEMFEGFILLAVVSTLLAILFFIMKLHLRIDEKGITYSYFPFVKVKDLTWGDLEKVWVRKYKPLREYGGWGLRIGFGTGRAYNVWGTKGLQLITNKGKKLLIGTQKADELAVFLKRLKEKYNIEVIDEAKLDG